MCVCVCVCACVMGFKRKKRKCYTYLCDWLRWQLYNKYLINKLMQNFFKYFGSDVNGLVQLFLVCL